jgi:ribosomal protein S19
MSRSIWKGIVLPKHDKTGLSNHLTLENRNTTITPDNVGKTFNINIGKDKPSLKHGNIGKVTVTTKHIGHKFGEYAISKIPAVYKRNSKKK